MLDLALRAAQAGAAALVARANQPGVITSKGYRDFVTEADLASQAAILAVIQAEQPQHVILSEESPQAGRLAEWQVPDGYWWVIDPLDGTTNFQLGMPTYGVSVGVAHGNALEAGVLVDPSRQMIFAAERGRGATLNGQPIHVSDRSELIEAVASCDWPRSPAQRKQAFELAGRFGNACRSFRSIGSAALSIAYLAAGWTDIYVHTHIKPWDCAAACLIAEEAGGVLLRHDGSPWTIMTPDLLAVAPGLRAASLAMLVS